MAAPGKTGNEYKNTDQERDNRSHDDTYGVNVVEIVAEDSNVVRRLQSDSSGNLKVNVNAGAGSGSTTSSVTSVSDSASSATLLSSNASRKEAIIQNDSDQVLYVKFGTTATTTDYTARLAQYGVLTTTYTGRIDGIWAANSTGAAKITELT